MGKHRNVPAPMVAEQSTQGPWAHLPGQPSQLLQLVGSVRASVTRPPFRILTTPAPPRGPSTGVTSPTPAFGQRSKKTQSLSSTSADMGAGTLEPSAVTPPPTVSSQLPHPFLQTKHGHPDVPGAAEAPWMASGSGSAFSTRSYNFYPW